MDLDTIAPEQVWRRRPVLAVAVRAAVFVVPILAALAVSILLSRVLPDPRGTGPVILWWATLLAGMVLTTLAVERICRRALPLGALLNIAMLFPDRAPSRFAVARRRGRPAELRAELDRVLARGHSHGRAIDDPDTHAALTVLTLLAAIAAHDLRTRGHSERVRVLVDMIAEEMDLPEADRYRLRWAALLHDVGKIEIAPDLLNKPGRPDSQEWEALHRHPAEGDRLCGPIREWLGPWADTTLHHHERWDGHGYPLGLRGEEICLGGRIVAVADAFEVMTAQRPYRHAVNPAAARTELVSKAGTQFDPAVCRAFVNISVGRLWRVAGVAAWMGEVPLLAPLIATLERVGVQGFARLVIGGSASLVAVTGAIALTPGPLPDTVVGGVAAAVQQGDTTPPTCCPGGPHLLPEPWQRPAGGDDVPAPPPASPASSTRGAGSAGSEPASDVPRPDDAGLAGLGFGADHPLLEPPSSTGGAASSPETPSAPAPAPATGGSPALAPASGSGSVSKRCAGQVPAAATAESDDHAAVGVPASCAGGVTAPSAADPDSDEPAR